MNASSVSRLVRAPLQTVYRACSDPHELVLWRMPQTMIARLLGIDGATYRMELGYPDGRVDTFTATFIERVPYETVVERIRFDAPERAGEMTMTTTLRAAPDGTEVSIRYDGLPDGIRPEDNDEGTRQALARLDTFVGHAGRR
jgi:uncharacterized protein YndB with AHSA1/START domain